MIEDCHISFDVLRLLAVVILSPACIFFFQAVLNRLAQNSPPQLIAGLSIILGFLPFLATITHIPFCIGYDPLFQLYLALIYILTAYVYFHFFNMSLTSRRIRLVLAVGATSLPEGDAKALYQATDMVTARLRRLVGLRQLAQQGNVYFSTRINLFAIIGAILYLQSRYFGKPWGAIERWRRQ
jgi:hypothetical protein